MPNKAMLGYGGNTPCVEVSTPDTLLIIDAGTGIVALGEEIKSRSPIEGHILFSHTHWDHIQGFPFFVPLFSAENHFTLYGVGKVAERLRSILKGQMERAFFPVRLEELSAQLTFVSLAVGEHPIGDILVESEILAHPNGVLAFRLSEGERSVVYASDVELCQPAARDKLTHFARGCDLLIADAQYSPEEYAGGKVGWGHGTWKDAAIAARQAGVGQLALFHHDPNRTDQQVADFERQAREIFPDTVAAREGMVIDLSGLAKPSKAERRRQPRANVATTAALSTGREAAPVLARTLNLSASGALCVMDRKFALYDKLLVSLKFELYGEDKEITAGGVVVRLDPSPEQSSPTSYQMAIFFSEISPEAAAVISEFVQTKSPS